MFHVKSTFSMVPWLCHKPLEGVLEEACNLILCLANISFLDPISLLYQLNMYSRRFWRGSRLWFCVGQIFLSNDFYHFSINISYVRGLGRGPVINSFFIGIIDIRMFGKWSSFWIYVGQYSFTGFFI